ncbi:hypothetical protein BCV72DRAFT_334221 [Rhizopus microsporus var. microsporus]|uniref:Uncharacterized protein n=1 Tax=Rhizopus microsporus var. microsporus TaxID=86635 RepID=A0A1X0R9N9_RHIZD|nr:hypothetical protein BCV72DRAFT_334221 [Rhizopus microsporus var. microsporus]
METDFKKHPTSNTGGTTVDSTVLASYDHTDHTLATNCDENEQALDVVRWMLSNNAMQMEKMVALVYLARTESRSLSLQPKNVLRFFMNHQS